MKQIYLFIFVLSGFIFSSHKENKVSSDYTILIDPVSNTTPQYTRQPSGSIELTSGQDPYEYLVHVYPHDSAKQQSLRERLLKAEREKDTITYVKLQAEMQHHRCKNIEDSLTNLHARNREAGRIGHRRFWYFVGLWAAGITLAQVVTHVYKWAV